MADAATVSHGSSRLRRCIIAIEGVVQGIGLRPAVYHLAVRHGLGGSVRNTMAGFALCSRCRREYETPSDRRFHAETIACPRCGPLLALHGADGAPAAADPIRTAAAALRDGCIVGIKGIGGYHLACAAT